jgi:hypothetical protein
VRRGSGLPILHPLEIFPPTPLPSIAASFARSADERVSRAAASLASVSLWSAAAACGGVPSEAASRASAFAFSGSLVQTLVQTGKGVGVSACWFPLASCVPLLDKLGVGSSSLLPPTPQDPLTVVVSGSLCWRVLVGLMPALVWRPTGCGRGQSRLPGPSPRPQNGSRNEWRSRRAPV